MEAPRCPFSRGMWANMPSTMRLIQGIAAASRRGCLERWGCAHGLVRLPWAALTDAAGADGESCLLPFHAVDLWFDRTASHPQRAEPPHPDVTEQPSAAQALFLTSLGGGGGHHRARWMVEAISFITLQFPDCWCSNPMTVVTLESRGTCLIS